MANVLVLGSGGREHALCYRLSKSPSVKNVYCAPGSYGMKDVAQAVPIDIFDHDIVIKAAEYLKVDLVLVGPETVLDAGITDSLEEAGIKVFGPNKKATQLESSKSFSKDFMKRYNIPTAAYETFTDLDSAKAYLDSQNFPVVIKASGLAAGKGVIIAENKAQAIVALESMMVDKRFGDSADEVIIEEFMVGEEFSLLVLCHNETALPLQVTQDYKRAFDNDKGENTGGMGSYTPVDNISQEIVDKSMAEIVMPTLKGMIQDGNPFTGVLFCGIMKTSKGVETIEFNVRFGDPETESLMLAFESDLYEIILSVLDENPKEIQWSKDYHCGVVMSAPGYPEEPRIGELLKGLEHVPNVFHMGTHFKDDAYYTCGGRVLFVHGSGKDLEEAAKNAYKNIHAIQSEGIHFRKDIGK